MKSVHLILVLLACSLMLLQCSSQPTLPPDNNPEQSRELTQFEKKLVSSGNSFGLKLFKQMNVVDSDKNIFISPLSVSMALGMTYNGANGTTQEAMQQTLELQGMSLQEVNESYRSLIDLLAGLDPEVEFNLANSIWCRENSNVRQEFIDLNKTYFDATVQEVDFTNYATVDLINSWISENTNGFIKKVLEPPLDANLYMMLINAIYFKGSWTYQFDKEDTAERDFILVDSSIVKCDMMRAEIDFSSYLDKDFVAISLPYGNGDYSMTILRPYSYDGIDALIESFDSEVWNSVLTGLKPIEETLIMPKFELNYKKSLKEMLTAMGMGIAFDEWEADFSNIREAGGLFISDVEHVTRVRVDEEGTEAAAVTVVTVGATSAGPMPYFVNSPFLLLIHENNSNTILFMGKVLDPTTG